MPGFLAPPVLVQDDGVGDLGQEPLRHRDVGLGGVPAGGGRRPHDLRPQRPQCRHLLVGHLLREHDDAAVALEVKTISWK